MSAQPTRSNVLGRRSSGSGASCRQYAATPANEAEHVPDGGTEVASEDGGRSCEALEVARGADPVQAAHQKSEVEGGGLNQDPFSDLLPASNVDTAESSRLQHVREATLQLLAPLARQNLAGRHEQLPLPPLAPPAHRHRRPPCRSPLFPFNLTRSQETSRESALTTAC